MYIFKEIFTSPKNGNYLFGYYDKSQIYKNRKYYACLKVKNIFRYPKKNESAKVGVFTKEGKFIKLDYTKCFNFQQGAMINWIYIKNQPSLIYNVVANKHFKSRIVDLNGKKIDIDYPLYSLSPNNKYFLTVNFYHLTKYRRGYSYGLSNIKKENKFFKENEIGIWKYDFNKKRLKKLISSDDFQTYNNQFWIEHINISPNNFDFVFLLRYKKKDGGINTDFYLSDIKKTKIIKINNSGRTSHFNWIDKEKLIVYGGIQNKFNTFRKTSFVQNFPFIKFLVKIYHFFINHNTKISKKITGDCYYIFNTKKLNFKKITNNEINLEDGHPCVETKKKRYMITDIYSDLPRKKPSLLLFDLKKNKIVQKIYFNSIQKLDNSPLRCDLHPRILKNSMLFSIDLFIGRNRAFKVFKISKK